MYLQGQQCVAVVVCVEHVVVVPGLGAQRRSGTRKFRRRDDASATERLLHERDVAERAGRGHSDTFTAVIPAPRHAAGVPAVAPQRLLNHGLLENTGDTKEAQREDFREEKSRCAQTSCRVTQPTYKVVLKSVGTCADLFTTLFMSRALMVTRWPDSESPNPAAQ